MDRRPSFSALDIISKVIREHVRPGDICIDATAGRGNDTAMLCELVGEEGHVLKRKRYPALPLISAGFPKATTISLRKKKPASRPSRRG